MVSTLDETIEYVSIEEALKIFPYQDIRDPQKLIMQFINHCIEKGQTGIFEGATCIGKTMAVLASILPHLQNGTFEKLVFLTRTNSQADHIIKELLKFVGDKVQSIHIFSFRATY